MRSSRTESRQARARSRRRALGLLLALLLAAPLAAQELELSGRVVEARSGAPVSGAEVEVRGARAATALTGPDGRWRVAGLQAGAHRVRVTHFGFGSWEGRAEVGAPTSAAELVVSLSRSALPLDAVVVTASRRLQRLADAPVTTELITRAEIEQARVSDLSTLLTERVGIQLQGGHPVGEGVMLQGLGSERVLILMDGQPVVGRVSGTLDLSRIPTSMIERVEVLKGAQSSLFGSEAMGGVINIITRDAPAEAWESTLDVTAGTQGRMDVAGTFGGTAGPARYLADLGRRNTELTPGHAGEQAALASRWDGSVKLGWSPAEALSLEGSFVRLDERQRWRDGVLYSFADNVQTGARLGAVWEGPAGRLSPTVHLSQFEHLSRRATSSTPVEGSGETETQRLLEAEVLYNGAWGIAALDAGVEAKREFIESGRVWDGERSLHTVEPFAQATLDLGRVQLVPGARLTWSEQWGNDVAPRVAALFRPVPSLALRGSVGRGFRAPGFKELGMEFLNVGAGFGYVVRGNPGLAPERSTSASLGLEWNGGTAYARGQGYYNRFDDFIETRLVGDSSGITVYSYGNVDDGHTRGVELEGGVFLGGLRAEAGYGYLEAEDGATGETLLGRPKHSGRLSLEHPLPLAFRGSLAGIYTGEAPVRRDEAGATEWRSGFLRFDLRLARLLPGGMELSLGARNLFDERPADWPGAAPRHLFLGIGWTLTGPARGLDPDRS